MMSGNYDLPSMLRACECDVALAKSEIQRLQAELADTNDAYEAWFETAGRQRDLIDHKNTEIINLTERVGVLEEAKNMMRGQLKIFSGLKCDCGMPCDCYSWKAMAVDSSATLAKLKALEDSDAI